MSSVVNVDRKANADEVRAHAAVVRDLAVDAGLGSPRLRDDGTVVVHSEEPGYRSVNRFADAAAAAVGSYVHVITDDVPGALSARAL